MVELSKFFIKDTDSKELIQITFSDQKYISTEKVTKFKVISKCFKIIFSVLFKINNMPANEIYPNIKNFADKVYGENNKYREENDEELIEYEEFFSTTKNDKPNYIG